MTDQNHPPIANRLIMVDFDGTIVPWGELMASRPPFPGVADALRRFRDAGWRIGIFTSRMSRTWAAAAAGAAAGRMALVAVETGAERSTARGRSSRAVASLPPSVVWTSGADLAPSSCAKRGLAGASQSSAAITRNGLRLITSSS